jgi:hypothetical protein
MTMTSQPYQPYQQPAPQGYAPPQAPVQPFPHPSPEQVRAELRTPPVAPPTLREFMNQPAGGGNSLSFMQAGTRYSGTVIRTVTTADVDFATEMQDQTKVAKFRDGREKLILKVPLLLDAPSAAYPDGTAIWILKSNDRNELMRAMEAAGAQIDPELGFYRIQAGDWLSVTYTHDQPSGRGLNPRKVKAVEYRVGNGMPPQMPQYQPDQQFQQDPYGQQYLAPQQQFQPPQQGYQQYGPQPTMQMAQPAPYQQPAFQDPAAAYQQATGQPMQPPPQQYQQAPPQPGQYPPPETPSGYPVQQYQQAPPQGNGFPPTQGAPAAPPGYTPGAQPTGSASPSNGSPPPNWPADVPFIEGLTPEMARTVRDMRVGGQQQAPY